MQLMELRTIFPPEMFGFGGLVRDRRGQTNASRHKQQAARAAVLTMC